MAKETYYFSHDYDPTGDPKMQAMVGNYGAAGYGMFWRIVEMLHAEECHKIPLKKYIFEAIAKQMLTNAEQVSTFVEDCIKNFELFLSDGNFIWSNRVIRNIEKREDVSKVRSKAGKASAEKRKQMSTHVEQPLTNVQQNPTKERKGKEIKENTLLCPSMLQVFLTHYPEYPKDEESDFPSCLRIAYKIASKNEWSKESVLNGNMDATLDVWEKMVIFSKSDNWYSTRAISDFDKEFQRLSQKFNASDDKKEKSDYQKEYEKQLAKAKNKKSTYE